MRCLLRDIDARRHDFHPEAKQANARRLSSRFGMTLPRHDDRGIAVGGPPSVERSRPHGEARIKEASEKRRQRLQFRQHERHQKRGIQR